MKNSINAKMLANFVSRGVFLFNPKFQKFWLESNRTDHFGLVWPEYLTTPLKVVHFGLSYWYDPNDPFHLTLLLSPLLLICTLLTSTYRNTQWLG